MATDPSHKTEGTWCWQAVASTICGTLPLVIVASGYLYLFYYQLFTLSPEAESAVIPLTFFFPLLSGLCGVVLGIIGIIAVKELKQKGLFYAVAGIVLSVLVIALIFCIPSHVKVNTRARGCNCVRER